MIERIRYGGVSNPYNYSEFTCDTAADIADLPTNKDIGKYKNLDTCSIGSKATVISDRTMYILNGDSQWVLLKDYKATGGGSSILIDETLTESGQAADAKVVGDKIAEVKESAHTHSNKDVLDDITSNKITTWDGYSAEIQTVKDGLVGKKDTSSPNSTGEVFNNYGFNTASGKHSHAEGGASFAYGDYSHAESQSTASGDSSHAEGGATTASGNYSHAEGWKTTASGRYSHAEGDSTTASGSHSHAEGINTTASGRYSHAEGDSTTASGSHSHAEGINTTASGNFSHAEGSYTVASGDFQHVQGKSNVEDSVSKYAFIIGNGTDNDNRSNAFSVDWNGKVYVNNATEGVDVSALATTIAELQSQLSRKTIQFRHGKGTLTATAEGTNITWQYGGQQVQGDSCTFDVKSDNGLITLECDVIESFTIKNDATNKMDLSDLGGKITNTLNLYGCTNVTGDLSDLGGKIANTLNLNGCSSITGVYSGTKYPKTFSVSKTAITSADMDANLINFAASGVKSGTLTATGMKRTAASDNAVATLVANGWTVSGLTKEG